MTNYEATLKVVRLKQKMTVERLAKKLGMSKVTMYTRLKSNKWKLAELALIDSLNDD